MSKPAVSGELARELVGRLDLLANVAELAQLVLPHLGSWSIVSVVDEHAAVRDAGSWHIEPDRRADVAAFSEVRLGAFVEESLVVQVARTGEPVILRDHALDAVTPMMRPGAARDLLVGLAPEFVAVLPMTASGRIVGVLTVYSDVSWTPEQYAVADQVTARAALVIANSLSYERERAARATAEAAEQRLSLLAQVSDALASSDDPDEAIGRLAGLVVPTLADWSFVTVIGEDASLRDIGIAHRDPAKYADLAAYSEVHLEAMSEDAAVSRALRTGAPVIVPNLREEILTSFLPDPWVAELTRRLAPYGVASFPLTARGRTLGALTLATTGDRGPHTEQELALGLEIARRAGPVLDAARAARRARNLAESIQRSVLVTTPPGPGMHVATRYRPAFVDHEIGGDWYDTFTLPNGSTIVSIGDVMGHDVAAIAAMAQLRTLMRAVAWTLGHSPAQILAATDAANVGLGTKTFATAIAVEVQPPATDGSVEIRWSSAGHLPPIVIEPDGTVAALSAQRPDIPLGVLIDVARHDHRRTLALGSLLLLYTDGLIERRDRDLQSRLDALTRVLERNPEPDIDVMLDLLLVEFTDESSHSDDVALLALRVGAPPPTVRTEQDRRHRMPLPATARASALARAFVEVNCTSLDADALADVLVLASELVTNSVRYGDPEHVLELIITEDTVRVNVSDDGPELLVHHQGAPDTRSVGGRGLLIVDSIASAWGVVHSDDSRRKTVWAELRLG